MRTQKNLLFALLLITLISSCQNEIEKEIIESSWIVEEIICYDSVIFPEENKYVQFAPRLDFINKSTFVIMNWGKTDWLSGKYAVFEEQDSFYIHVSEFNEVCLNGKLNIDIVKGEYNKTFKRVDTFLEIYNNEFYLYARKTVKMFR